LSQTCAADTSLTEGPPTGPITPGRGDHQLATGTPGATEF